LVLRPTSAATSISRPATRHPDYLANRPGATIGGRPFAPLPSTNGFSAPTSNWCDRQSVNLWRSAA
jgi:hypothetical protein